MAAIHHHVKELRKMTRLIKTMLGVDAAVFDKESHLLAATEEYLNQKGKKVHAPSIQEALANGDVLVNKPGHMPACSGCRFTGNCPAKIEILKSIRLKEAPLGVMTFTSFTSEGHDRISQDIPAYVEALSLFSDWAARTVEEEAQARAALKADRMLTELMEMAQGPVLVTDPGGMVVRGNARALKLFSFCDLYTRSLFHLLPEPVVEKVLEGKSFEDFPVQINQEKMRVSARPIHAEDRFTGALITLFPLMPAKPQPGPALPGPAKAGLDQILGQSPVMEAVRQKAAKVANSASTILITGDTGTGKGLLARTIHDIGNRRQGPFVPVNCAAIPDTLFESELFGYEEGAFTGAKKGGKPGRFELAHGGTLFLDEIGEMPLHLQAKLLNVLQDSAFQRVGGLAFIPVDVRVIAATNQDLDRLVAQKKFRADLFFRLNVIPLDLPPLSARSADLAPLCQAFIQTSNQRAGKQVRSLSPEVMARLTCHRWPGNIRELQNLIEYAVNMTPGEEITLADLPDRFLSPGITEPQSEDRSIRETAATAEVLAIEECLDRFGHDLEGKKKTAQALDISLRTLYRKLKARPSF